MKINRAALCLILALLLFLTAGVTAFADDGYEGGYEIVIDDEADLFTDEQEELLRDRLGGVLPYGNAGVVTRNSHSFSGTDKLAENVYEWYFGTESGSVFVIDMQYRNMLHQMM